MERKIYFNHTSEEQKANPLEGLREEIDNIDDQILKLLAQRMVVAKKVGENKRNRSAAPLDSIRWREVINLRITKGEELGLNGVFMQAI